MTLNPLQPSDVAKVVPVQYQSMDDWMKEQDELDQQLKHSTGSPRSPPAKKQRTNPTLDTEELTFERKVEEVLGVENWIGVLQRKPFAWICFAYHALILKGTPMFTPITNSNMKRFPSASQCQDFNASLLFAGFLNDLGLTTLELNLRMSLSVQRSLQKDSPLSKPLTF